MQPCSSGFLDFLGLFYISLVLHEDESKYVIRLVALIEHPQELKGLKELQTGRLDRSHDSYYLNRDADSWSRELYFELRHRRSSESQWPSRSARHGSGCFTSKRPRLLLYVYIGRVWFL